MKNLNFFYRVDKQGYPVPGSLQRFEQKPTNGRWQQLDYNNICCIPEPESVPEDQTINFNYLTPLPGISYRVHLVGEGGQGYFSTGVIDENTTTDSLTIPNTGLYTVILEVISGSGDCTMLFTNSGIAGFNPIDTPVSYVAYNRNLSLVTVMNSLTPCA